MISVIASTGPALTNPVTVPDITGKGEEVGEEMLADLGLVSGTVTKETSEEVPAGTIIRQAIAPNTQVEGGTAIDYVVSSGSIYLPLCDGRGNQMSYGIAEELFHLSISQGVQERYPKAWLENGTKEERSKQRFEVQFNPQSMALLAEEILLENGVKILYDTRINFVPAASKAHRSQYCSVRN